MRQKPNLTKTIKNRAFSAENSVKMPQNQCFSYIFTKATNRYTIRDALKRIFPERHIHELRYSFITRAKECGCNPELVMKWVGHEFDADVKTSRVDRGYTTYSQEYILQEINKIDYEL